jgi:hypothetical protein
MEDKYMKSSLIKITKSVVALIAFVAAGGLLVGAFHSGTASANVPPPFQTQCSNATLQGAYAFRVSGEVFVPGTSTIAVYRDGVAMTTFDGMGGLTQVDWLMGNGVADPEPPATENSYGFHDNETGTYTVNADCTGNAEIDFKSTGAVIKLKFVLAEGGRVIHTIVYSLTPPGAPAAVPANIHSDAEKL